MTEFARYSRSDESPSEIVKKLYQGVKARADDASVTNTNTGDQDGADVGPQGASSQSKRKPPAREPSASSASPRKRGRKGRETARQVDDAEDGESEPEDHPMLNRWVRYLAPGTTKPIHCQVIAVDGSRATFADRDCKQFSGSLKRLVKVKPKRGEPVVQVAIAIPAKRIATINRWIARGTKLTSFDDGEVIYEFEAPFEAGTHHVALVNGAAPANGAPYFECWLVPEDGGESGAKFTSIVSGDIRRTGFRLQHRRRVYDFWFVADE